MLTSSARAVETIDDPHRHANNVVASLPNELVEIVLFCGIGGDDIGGFLTASASHFLLKFCSLSNASMRLCAKAIGLSSYQTLETFKQRAKGRLMTALTGFCNEAFVLRLKSPRTRARAYVEFANAVSKSSWRVELRWGRASGGPMRTNEEVARCGDRAIVLRIRELEPN